MVRALLAVACMIVVSVQTQPAFGQSTRKTVILEVLAPEDARLFIEDKDTRSTGAIRRFESPPLSPGKYTYTLKAVIAGPNGAQTMTRIVDVRPGDFEEIDFRPRREGDRVPDVLFEATPDSVVDALLDLASLKHTDVLWDLGCGDGRIPVAAAYKYGIQARGFDIDPNCVEEARSNVRVNDLEHLVEIEDRDIFTLDLSRGPTVVTLYLLPSLNARLLPQLRKLPDGARVVSVGHRMGDIPPDKQVTVDAEDGDYTLYLWSVETLRRHAEPAVTTPSAEKATAVHAVCPMAPRTQRCGGGRFRRR
jgi:uncharacterized protein (TIGR03000 family)